MSQIFQALEQNSSLTVLNLSSNYITEKVFEQLMEL